jgi:hypothetical protein
MKTTALLSAGLAATLVGLLPAAQAQAKSFVSSTGSGTTCTRAVPCNNFADAHDATEPGGEINCLDSGPFIGATISKSITIDCAGLAATALGFVVNGAGIVVRIRNLSFVRLGSSFAIDFQNGAALFVENCIIQNKDVVAPAIGIRFRPSAGVTAKLYVSDSVISNNGLPADGGGIIIQPSGSGSARVVLDRIRVENNTHGIQAIGTGSTGAIVVQVRDSVVTGGIGNGIAAITMAGASPTGIVVDRSSSVSNAGSGILAQGSGALVHIGSSTVVGNGAGLNAASGGQILSYQNNQASGNAIDGAATGVLTVK